MKKIFVSSLASIFSLILVTDSFAQLPQPVEMKSTTKEKNTLSDPKALESLKHHSKQNAKKESLPAPVAPAKLVKEQADYLHPGILVNLRGKWEGSDHLLNINNNIGVYVTIIKPENEIFDIKEDQIKKSVEFIFIKNNIKPQNIVSSGSPPLPAFQIEIFVYPIDKGYVAYCGGSLFESVILDRFKMDSNMAFQAITWEKQNLIVSPKEQLIEQITKTVEDIANTFSERFQAYERIKRTL